MSVSERREVGDNANSEFYWKVSDYGRSVFSTKEEAAVLAGERAHDMNRGISSTKYISRPMYKNWMHWNDEAGRKIARQQRLRQKLKEDLRESHCRKDSRKLTQAGKMESFQTQRRRVRVECPKQVSKKLQSESW